MQHYDIIIIGSGPGGYTAAQLATARGLKVAVVERDKLGGTCLNRGCIPTKCMCAAAERLIAIGGAPEFGITATATADYSVAHHRAAEVIATLRQGVKEAIADAYYYHGEARLCTGHIVVVGSDMLKADKIIIATGSEPARMPFDGAEYVLSSDAFLGMSAVPDNIVIIGGGVIGLEFASILAAYGKNVTVLEYCREVLPAFDAQIAKRLRTYLTRRGIKIITQAQVTAVDADHTVHYTSKGKDIKIEADLVIGAVGRWPVIPDGAEELDIEADPKGFIAVDDHFETSVPGIYAIGDVNGGTLLAHAAEAQARVVTGVSDTIGSMPAVVFTNPECATVGVNADSADGLQSVTVPYSACAKAVAAGETEGAIKIVYDSDLHLVGCQAVGVHAADLIAEAAIAIDAQYSLRDIATRSVAAHPSMSELLTIAAEQALG